jgi:hypothetical protein
VAVDRIYRLVLIGPKFQHSGIPLFAKAPTFPPALPAFAADAEMIVFGCIELAQFLDLSAIRADLTVRIGVLANADEELRVFLDHLPVEPTYAKPAVIDPHGVLEGIADKIDDVYGIAPMVWFLNKDVDPDLVVDHAMTSE